MDKIVYKDADYKFGRPVGYLNPDEFSDSETTKYLYKDELFTEKFTSNELKSFYYNAGICKVIIEGKKIAANPQYLYEYEPNSNIYIMVGFVFDNSYDINPKEIEE